MKKTIALLMLSCVFLTAEAKKSQPAAAEKPLRAPAVPLVTSDPYFSVWSASDVLTDKATSHWTGKTQSLIGAIRVDGKTYRVLGTEQVKYETILPTGVWQAMYTESKPSDEWMQTGFNDAAWRKGRGSFGNNDYSDHKTDWNTPDIWIRRTFDLKEDLSNANIVLEFSHDDDFELYINGNLVVATGYTWKMNAMMDLDAKIKASLKPGKNVIAAHCKNQVGGALVDFGLVKRIEQEAGFSTAAIQKNVKVLPTQSVYNFECGPVGLELTFTAPLLLNDLNLVSMPINYVTYKTKSLDKKNHDVQIYFEASPQLAVTNESQPVNYDKFTKNNMVYVKTGTIDQPVLAHTGDDIRIDWGYLYLGTPFKAGSEVALCDYYGAKKNFVLEGKLPVSQDPKTISSDLKAHPSVLAYSENLGAVGANAVSGHILIGYDDKYSIRYFYENLMAYWKHDGRVQMTDAFEWAENNYAQTIQKCNEFDAKMLADAEKSGGKKYAELCALAYRQAISAHKLVKDKEGNLLFLSKENNSNGCINTVDVTYPSAPLFLLYNTDLMKGMLTPIFHYSESKRWNKPFPSHDLGQYPLANGQVYGDDMPIEEGGNMVILTTAVCIKEKSAAFAEKHWDVLTIWADYLIQAGMDPENQLCTDDFAGHFAHNSNLSIKAIMGIAGYGKLAEMLGKADIAKKYTETAKAMAAKWVTMANDGDHFRLTFDKENTWSQKYNIVWDKVLGLNIFPAEVIGKEIPYYLTHQQKYGLPLDSRRTYTKSDWIMWTACLTDSPADFNKFIDPIYNYANETKSRVPLSDWHETTNAEQVGFKARSVVGGYFMKMLEDELKKP